MTLRKLGQRVSLALCFGFVLIHVLAKLDFFAHYSQTETITYLREHSIYWIVMAVVAFVVWLLERFSSDKVR